MAKQRGPSLASAVERQAGACRNLATLMRRDAERRGFFDRADRHLIDGWAHSLDEVADALTLALADGDKRQVGRMGKAAVFLAGALMQPTVGFMEGAGQAIFGEIFDESAVVQEQAKEVVDAGEAVAVRISLDASKTVRSKVSPPIAATRGTGKSRMTLHSLGDELGMTDSEMMALADSMGVGVKSVRSTLIEAQADRMRRRAERDGLIRPGRHLLITDDGQLVVTDDGRGLGMT